MAKKHLFVSYSRQDASRVLPVVKLLRAMGIDIWMDVDDLRAGESWPKTIHKALEDSIGLIVFVSRAAMRSEWVRQEIIAASAHADRLIIPVMLEDVPDLPPSLAERQWLDFRDLYDTSRIELSVQQIADATQAHLHSNRDVPPLSRTETPKIAAAMAKEVRTVVAADTGKNQPPDSIFVVHGHDNRALSELENYLTDVSIKPFILSRMGGAAQSLLQKFFKSAADARFAIVILSGDDFGASTIQYDADGVGERALQFRARQNVILELGFFYGFLGWENVFVLYRKPGKVFPNFERPSDIDGAVFESMDDAGTWRDSLSQKLKEAGFRVNQSPK